jgi:tRNA A-37 threonylcarbamoyl transferase component Bud32
MVCAKHTIGSEIILDAPDDAPASFQRCMMSIFSNMIEEIMEVFMDGFSIYGKTFDDCLEKLDKVLQNVKKRT